MDLNLTAKLEGHSFFYFSLYMLYLLYSHSDSDSASTSFLFYFICITNVNNAFCLRPRQQVHPHFVVEVRAATD